ncbi:MAG: choice-of-anchor L domain-containing protein [Anaerolineae bacterium]|nr:choice-of-anchor L domain-containing protein [Anaerolineae bacterium]
MSTRHLLPSFTLALCLVLVAMTGPALARSEMALVEPPIQSQLVQPGPRTGSSPARVDSPAIAPIGDLNTIAAALNIPLQDVISIRLLGSDIDAFGRGQSSLGYHFPLVGTEFLIMATGLATSASAPNSSGSLTTILDGLNNQQGNDLVQLELKLSVPSGVNCASIDFAFYSEEFPEYVGSAFNDAFTAEFGGTNLSIEDSSIVAPLNYAFDAEGNLITVNTVSGVTEPTDSTYDGRTPLRRAQVGVEPNDDIILVFSIQDLGDSRWDSAVFLDNFFWSNNADCGGFVEPLPQPISALQLHMPSALPTGASIRPTATVTNLSDAPTAYTLKVDLRRGFGVLDSYTYPLLLGPGEIYQQVVDFGLHGPDAYYIRAELLQGTELLESLSAPFTVGESYLKLQNKMDELTEAAHAELGQGQEIAKDVLSKAVFQVGKEALVKATSYLSSVLSKLGGSIGEQLVEELGEEFLDWYYGFGDVLETTTENQVGPWWRAWLDERAYNDRHSAVDAAAAALIDEAKDNVFTWLDAWDADVAHYRAVIENRNEAAEVGYGIDLDAKWPPYHRATLTDLEGQFFFVTDTVLPVVETLLSITLVLLCVAAIIVGIFSIAASAGVATPGVVTMIGAVLPGALSAFKAAGLTKTIGGSMLVIYMAVLVGLTATGSTSLAVVDEHDKAMEDFGNRIELAKSTEEPASILNTTTHVDDYKVTVEFPSERASSAAPIYAQLFRGDGQLLAFERVMGNGTSTNSLSWHVPPGPYWTVVTSSSANGRTSVRQEAKVAVPEVALSLDVADRQLQPGELIVAHISVANMSGQSIGPVSLMVRALPLETMEIREFELNSNQTQTFDLEFLPSVAGSYIVQAFVSDEEQLLATWERGVIVGSGAALSMNVTAGGVYSPGSDVSWNASVENGGNQSAEAEIEIDTYARTSHELIHSDSMTVSVAGGSQRDLSLSVLPDAAPGAYTTYVRLDKVVRSATDFLVTADGALFVITQVTPQFVSAGQMVTVTAHVQDEAYMPLDATVLTQITLPSGNIVSLTMQRIGAGHYEGSYTPSAPGTHSILIVASKTDYAVAAAETYLVADDPSLLKTEFDDQLVLNETKAVEILVKNEAGIAVSDATVILSFATGVQVEQTDVNGVVALSIRPRDEEPFHVQVKKPGFADTQLTLPVAIGADTTPPPAMWLPPQLTNDPNYGISGHTEPGAIVTVQGKIVAVEADGDFIATVSLHEGSNSIIGTINDAAGNQTTLTATIILDTVPPDLTVHWPVGQPSEWGPTVQISGYTEPNLLVNVIDANVASNNSGYFVAWVSVGATSSVEVTATDQAGNVTTEIYKSNSQLFLPIALQIPYVRPDLPLLNGNFESGPANWAEASSHGWPIIVSNGDVDGLPTHSGSWSAWLGGDDDEIAYIEQTVTVPADRPYLTYYHGIASQDSCGYDFGGVVLNDAVVVDQYDLCREASTPDWVLHAVNLSAYAGQDVALQIRVETDGSLNSNLFVDDVAFSASGVRLGEKPLPFVWNLARAALPLSRGAAQTAERLLGPAR